MARLMSVAMTTTAVIECGCERHPAPYVYLPHPARPLVAGRRERLEEVEER